MTSRCAAIALADTDAEAPALRAYKPASGLRERETEPAVGARRLLPGRTRPRGIEPRRHVTQVLPGALDLPRGKPLALLLVPRVHMFGDPREVVGARPGHVHHVMNRREKHDAVGGLEAFDQRLESFERLVREVEALQNPLDLSVESRMHVTLDYRAQSSVRRPATTFL